MRPRPGKGGGRTGRATPGRTKGKARLRQLDWDWWWQLNDQRFFQEKLEWRRSNAVTESSDVFLGMANGDDISEITTRQIRERIIPELKTAILDPYHSVRAGAAIALAKAADPMMLDVFGNLRSMLADEHKSVREAACLALGILGNEDALPLLFDLLEGHPRARKLVGRKVSTRTRAIASVSIGLVCARQGSDPMIIERLLRHAARPAGGNRDLAVGPAVALQLIKSRHGIAGMISLLEDQRVDAYVRAHVAVALGKIGAKQATGTLVKALRDRDAHVTRSAAISLGLLTRSYDRAAIKELMRHAAKNADRATRNFALLALGEVGSSEARAFLLSQARDGSTTHDRTYAALALGISGWKKKDAATRDIGATLLETFGTLKASGDKAAYALALGLMGHEAARPVLRAALERSRDASLQGHLSTALGLLQDKQAVPAIQRLVRSRADHAARVRAAIALGIVQDPDGMATLQKVITDGRDSIPMLGHAVVSLGYIGDKRAAPFLTELVEPRPDGSYTSKDVVRAFGAVALGLLADKDDMPILYAIQENSNYLAQTETLEKLLGIL